jgi:UDP-N-acetylmuramoylalanine--D-glutamate ligase
MKPLAQLNVLILGLGQSGLAMARWCSRRGATVAVWDSRDSPPGADALQRELPQARRIQGALSTDHLSGVHLLLKSPGLAPHDERIALVMRAARRNGVEIAGELDLFVQALAELKAEQGYAPKLIAITGTNGKTTTTAMTAMLVERTGRRVAAAGNIGPTMLDTLAEALDVQTSQPLPQVWVLELSSFQLDGAEDFEPDAATVLNLTQDHLDWHGSIEAYARAKANVFGRNATMVINRDDARVVAMLPEPAPARLTKSRAAKPAPRRVVRFGLDAPREPGDFGLITEGGMAWLVRALEVEPAGKRALPAVEPAQLHLQRLMPADALRVRGRHNAANALAALALACAIGCPLAPMLHGLREYAGEPHRTQFVARVDDIEAFDDSKGTNVGATVAALRGLGSDRSPAKLVLILGGDGKGQDFAPLVEPVAQHVRAVALIGRDAAIIESALGPAAAQGVVMQRHDSLPAAVAWCFAQGKPGDAVLLSPACASFDMFRNYGQRAEVFVQAVRALAAESGTVAA